MLSRPRVITRVPGGCRDCFFHDAFRFRYVVVTKRQHLAVCRVPRDAVCFVASRGRAMLEEHRARRSRDHASRLRARRSRAVLRTDELAAFVIFLIEFPREPTRSRSFSTSLAPGFAPLSCTTARAVSSPRDAVPRSRSVCPRATRDPRSPSTPAACAQTEASKARDRAQSRLASKYP